MKTAVMFSGGIDSTVLLKEHEGSVGIFIDYPHPAREAERKAAVAIGNALGRKVISVTVPLVWDPDDPQKCVIPGRNQLFLTVGSMEAMAEKCSEVVYGANASDQSDYLDCRPQFIQALNRLHRLVGLPGVRAPLLRYTKAQVRSMLDAELLAMTTSCYYGNACGKCASCLTR